MVRDLHLRPQRVGTLPHRPSLASANDPVFASLQYSTLDQQPCTGKTEMAYLLYLQGCLRPQFVGRNSIQFGQWSSQEWPKG